MRTRIHSQKTNDRRLMKQILLINDVVGYSKVGMVAMLPILSYLGIPTYSLR